jgi:hypothetical protein
VLKDREVLLTHFDFPVEHWIHLRTPCANRVGWRAGAHQCGTDDCAPDKNGVARST